MMTGLPASTLPTLGHGVFSIPPASKDAESPSNMYLISHILRGIQLCLSLYKLLSFAPVDLPSSNGQYFSGFSVYLWQ